MNKQELKKLIAEELSAFKMERNTVNEVGDQKPVLDPKKSAGIILGAVKTLFNSGAIVGVDPSKATDITKDILKQMNVVLAPYGQQEQPVGDELEDETAYNKEEDTLDDQSQYDPDLSKQTSDYEPKSEEPEEEESLFEVRKIARKLKL